MSYPQSITKYIAAFVSELVNSGVEHVVISPGSRSTPIALIMAEHKDLKLHVHVDERSAAFFALGISKASKRPTVLLCTSGTAAANYYPAIVEAKLSRVPLLVLTADRPHELRDVGAPQAIDQIDLYGKHVKWFVEMAPPDHHTEMLRYARTICARAVSTSVHAPEGPVHLNFPFKEPLLPTLDDQLFEGFERPSKYLNIHIGVASLPIEDYKEMAKVISQSNRGIIVCGSIDDYEFVHAVVQFAESISFPIIADPLSQLRSGTHSGKKIIDTYDTFLRNEDVKKVLQPDLIIRFGAMPLSKALNTFLKENDNVNHIVIDSGGGFRDPAYLSTEMIYCDETQWCMNIHSFLQKKDLTPYLLKWQQINEWTRMELSKIKDVPSLSEGKLMYQLADLLPEGSTLFVGNSMPIRDLDTFFHYNHKSIKIMANRGANGIDGIISTALGAGRIRQPLYLVLGDLTFFHDLNGLIASKLYSIDIHIVLINNNGGGIFSFLPQHSLPKHFELLFGTPLGLDFRHIVKMYQGSYKKIQDWTNFIKSLSDNEQKSGLHVYEIETNREKNLEEHRNVWDSVTKEVSRFIKDEYA